MQKKTFSTNESVNKIYLNMILLKNVVKVKLFRSKPTLRKMKREKMDYTLSSNPVAYNIMTKTQNFSKTNPDYRNDKSLAANVGNN